jgi:hypothetical protein
MTAPRVTPGPLARFSTWHQRSSLALPPCVVLRRPIAASERGQP